MSDIRLAECGFPQSRSKAQKPRGDERQNLVMLPSLPVADFVIRQARFAIGSPNAFLNAVRGLGDACKFGYLEIGDRIRQVLVVL